MSKLQHAKQLVSRYQDALDNSDRQSLPLVLEEYTSDNYHWRGMHPFYEQHGAADTASVFWQPLHKAFSPLQRRDDIFLAGFNVVTQNSKEDTVVADADQPDDDKVWVCSMGHFFGLFDRPWLNIPPTGKMIFLPYAEFSCVQNNQIVESAFFCDIIAVMHQAGHYPLPPQTGAFFMHPGPRTHDGLLLSDQDPASGRTTMDLVHRMVDDLSELNTSGNDTCPPELLARRWTDNMIWYGPTGIGATYTIERYQKQHQYPFRQNLTDKVFNGHVARFAEGNYACFFGWSNLTNTATGGFLGMTGNDTRAEMRVVDVYRREGDKLAENWVFIDLLHYLSMQGLDVLDRLSRSLLPD